MDFQRHFGLTRVINLADRTDRLRQMQRQLEAIGNPLAAGKVEVFPAVRLQDAAGFPNAGTRGCFLSHLGVLKDARARGVSSVLVLEDDLEIHTSDFGRMKRVSDELHAHTWDVLHLGHILHLTEAAEALVTVTGPIQTAHFYAIHQRIYDRLIEYLEGCLVRPPGDPVGGPMHFDGALTMFRAANHDVITLVAQPSLGSQRSSRSDISYRSFEQLPVLKQAMGAARVLRRILKPTR